MTETLFADIGGTGSRLACFDGRHVTAPTTYINSRFASFDELLEKFLESQRMMPHRLALAVAGPVHNESVSMTNLGWHISAESLKHRFGIETVTLINDFAAIAWATLELQPQDLFQVGGGGALPNASRGVLGPGTGLGVSGLISHDHDWAVMVGEGGHVTIPATNSEEADMISRIAAEFGHCSAERLLSGPGLARIYALATGSECSPDEITRFARAGEPVALNAVQVFCAMLGTVAGNLALTLGARGGIYLAGGILPAISDLLAASAFRARFESKGRFADYLAAIPTFVVTRPNPSFAGLDIYLRRTQTGSK